VGASDAGTVFAVVVVGASVETAPLVLDGCVLGGFVVVEEGGGARGRNSWGWVVAVTIVVVVTERFPGTVVVDPRFVRLLRGTTVVGADVTDGAIVVVVVTTTGGAGMFTVMVTGAPVNVVCAFPAISVIAKPSAASSWEETGPPPIEARAIAAIVHVSASVCTIEVSDVMFVSAKSASATVERSAHTTSSSAVILNVMPITDDVADIRSNVTVGAESSIVIDNAGEAGD